jgi:hypothetical protein
MGGRLQGRRLGRVTFFFKVGFALWNGRVSLACACCAWCGLVVLLKPRPFARPYALRSLRSSLVRRPSSQSTAP